MKARKLEEEQPEAQSDSPAAYLLGVCLQGFLLGVLLYGSTLMLLIMRSGGRVFRYENF